LYKVLTVLIFHILDDADMAKIVEIKCLADRTLDRYVAHNPAERTGRLDGPRTRMTPAGRGAALGSRIRGAPAGNIAVVPVADIEAEDGSRFLAVRDEDACALLEDIIKSDNLRRRGPVDTRNLLCRIAGADRIDDAVHRRYEQLDTRRQIVVH